MVVSELLLFLLSQRRDGATAPVPLVLQTGDLGKKKYLTLIGEEKQHMHPPMQDNAE